MARGDGQGGGLLGGAGAGGQPQAEVPRQEVQPQPEGHESQEDKPGYVTVEQAQRMIAEATAEAIRRAQSMVDKGESRIQKRVQDRLQRLEETAGELQAMGHKLPDEWREQMRRNVVAEEMMASTYDQEDQPDGDYPVDPLTDYVRQRTMQIYQEAGIQLLKDDPEAGSVDHSSPENYLSTLQQALKAKRERIGGSSQGEQTDEPGGAPAAARLPGLGSQGGKANPIGNITDPRELIRLGLQGKR